jgi:hypothetical protein
MVLSLFVVLWFEVPFPALPGVEEVQENAVGAAPGGERGHDYDPQDEDHEDAPELRGLENTR